MFKVQKTEHSAIMFSFELIYEVQLDKCDTRKYPPLLGSTKYQSP